MNTNQEFSRKQRIGINPLTINEGQTKFLMINSAKPEVFTKKDGDDVDFVMATDLQTGEEGHFWLAGALKYQLNQLVAQRKTIAGIKVEVTHEGQKTIEIDGKKTNVNQYALYELN